MENYEVKTVCVCLFLYVRVCVYVCFVTQMFQPVGCTSCLMSGWRISSHLQEKGSYLLCPAAFSAVCLYKTGRLSTWTCPLVFAAIMSSVFPACCLQEGWPASVTGLSLFPPTYSSLVSRQVGVCDQYPSWFSAADPGVFFSILLIYIWRLLHFLYFKITFSLILFSDLKKKLHSC